MEISSLSYAELISVIATFHSSSQKEEPDFVGRGYSEQAIAAMRNAKNKGSTEVRTLNFKFTKPVKYFPCSNYDYLTTLFVPFQKHGVLPFRGALSEQPNKIIEIFNVMKALINESDEKLKKESERKSKGKQHG